MRVYHIRFVVVKAWPKLEINSSTRLSDNLTSIAVIIKNNKVDGNDKDLAFAIA